MTFQTKYHPSNTTCSFKVLKTPTSLDVKVDYNDDLNGTITVKTVPSNCTGEIGVYVNYELYTLNLTDGKAVFNVKYYKGTNYIYVYYDGDYYFDGSDWNTTLGMDYDFAFLGKNVTAWQENDFNYTIRLLEDNGIPLPSRTVTITFEGQNYTVTTNDNGFAYFKLNLPAGEYEIKATYRNVTIENTLTVNQIKFNLTSLNISYGDVETFEASFDKGITGNVNFIISNLLNVTVEIVDGKAIYNLSSLNVGNYVITAYYLNLAESSNFHVDKADLNVKVKADDVALDVDQIIEVSNLLNATGDIVFIVNGNEYQRTIHDSKCILNLSELETGNYTLIVKYSGDENYNNFTVTKVFYVKEFSSDIVLKVNGTYYGQNIEIIAELSDGATGTVRFTVNNMTKEAEIENGIVRCVFAGLNVGNYTIAAEYLGNYLYVSSSNSTTFNVVKANSTIDLYTKEIFLGENIRIYANLSPNATGAVSFSMVGYYTPRDKVISNSQSTWLISPLKTGSYTVIAQYNGDNNYYASNTTFILDINQKKAILDVVINDAGLNDRVTVKSSLISSDGDKLNATIALKINSRTYNIPIKNGESTFVLGKLDEGNYTFSATYEGNANYSKSSCEGKFVVSDELIFTNLSAENVEMFYKGGQKLIVKLLSSSGNAIAGEIVDVKIGSKSYQLTTDGKGIVSLDLDFASGNYLAVITFNETEKYHGSSTNASVKIYSTVEAIDVVKLYNTGTQYFAVFSDSNGNALANTKVTFKIGSNTLSTTTLPNGISKLNINLSPGKYSIVATNPVTGEKATNSIFVYNYLMENKDLTQYYGANKVYKVRAYDKNGQPVGAGVIVKIKVNGKTYSVKTDKNGYAKRSIALLPGTYTLKATYNGFTVSNKIKVKPLVIAKSVSKKKAKSYKYSAKLVNKNGKIVKGKKITFKIKGKKYTAKTNKKGIATITIKLKLKVGKYKIMSQYGKSKVTKTLTIKK